MGRGIIGYCLIKSIYLLLILSRSLKEFPLLREMIAFAVALSRDITIKFSNITIFIFNASKFLTELSISIYLIHSFKTLMVAAYNLEQDLFIQQVAIFFTFVLLSTVIRARLYTRLIKKSFYLKQEKMRQQSTINFSRRKIGLMAS